jgi:hypothetical protein
LEEIAVRVEVKQAVEVTALESIVSFESVLATRVYEARERLSGVLSKLRGSVPVALPTSARGEDKPVASGMLEDLRENHRKMDAAVSEIHGMLDEMSHLV